MNVATTSTPQSERACYVYGVVPESTTAPKQAQGVGDPPAPVTLVRHHRVAALVSEIDPGRPLGTPDDLRAHARILNSVAAERTPVLPFRFGGVIRDQAAVADELLSPLEEKFAAALAELDDHTQFTVRGEYQEDHILREILADRPDIDRLREQTMDQSADAGYYQRIQLGEMIAQEIDARRRTDTQVLLDRLGPLAAAVAPGAPAAEQAVDVSFLVHRAKRSAFEAAAEELAKGWAGRIDVRLLGPLAPYDFVAGIVEQAEEVL